MTPGESGVNISPLADESALVKWSCWEAPAMAAIDITAGIEILNILPHRQCDEAPI